MADKGIIFSAPMVRALLDGRKSQTRRVLSSAFASDVSVEWHSVPTPGFYRTDNFGSLDYVPIKVPYAPGDRLYVREAHALVPVTAYRMSDGVQQAVNPDDRDRAAIYREGWDRSTGGLRWRPSIHMPRWASRLTLIVTDVRVQRLQWISEADAWAEGCKRGDPDDVGGFFPADEPHPKGGFVGWDCARDWYADLWDSLHGPEAWEANPWVAAYTFTAHRCNIDDMPKPETHNER